MSLTSVPAVPLLDLSPWAEVSLLAVADAAPYVVGAATVALAACLSVVAVRRVSQTFKPGSAARPAVASTPEKTHPDASVAPSFDPWRNEPWDRSA